MLVLLVLLLTLPSPEEPVDGTLSELLVEAGGLHFTLGQYRRSAEAFAQVPPAAAAEDPDVLPARLMALLYAGAAPELPETLERFQEVAPDHPALERLSGVVLLQSGRHEEARLWYESRLQEDATAITGLILAHLLQGEVSEARQRVRQVLQDRGDSAALRILLARSLRRAAEAAEISTLELIQASEDHVRQALALDPDFRGVHYQLALTLLKKQGLEAGKEAVDALKTEVSKHPDHHLAQYYLGLLLAEDRSCEDAVRPLKESLKQAPDNHHARLILARCQYRLENLDAALAELQRLAALPAGEAGSLWDQSQVHYLLGRIFLKQRDRKAARSHLERADRLKKAWAREESDHLQTALSQSGTSVLDLLLPREPIPTGPERARIESRLSQLSKDLSGTYQLKAKQTASADLEATADNLERALYWDPGNLESRFNLAVAQARLARWEDAVQNLLTLLKERPDHENGRQLLRRSLLEFSRQQSPTSALQKLQQWSSAFPQEADLYLMQAELLRQLGRAEEAARVLEQNRRLQEKP